MLVAGIGMGIVVLVQSLASSPTRPGAVRASDTKTSCLDVNLGTELAQAEQATGINYRCIETFSDADPTWSDWVSPWVTHHRYGYAEWLAADPSARTIILTQNLIPDSVATNPNWRAICATGQYNHYARELAVSLVATGFGDVVIRLGHEMNGTWYNDSIGDTSAQWHEWAQCFARIVTAMRAVPGADFLFDWNVSAGYRNIPLADFYPGNAYVDIVGIDLYDSGPGSKLPAPSTARWLALEQEPLGLDAVDAFAVAHGKPLSIPEWGTETDAGGGGDDPAYVAGMGRFIATHDVAYQSWFDPGHDGILQLTHASAPRSLAQYRKAFG